VHRVRGPPGKMHIVRIRTAEEQKDKEERMNNIIIYRVPEGQSQNASERVNVINDDKRFVEQLLCGLQVGIVPEDIKKVMRLGKVQSSKDLHISNSNNINQQQKLTILYTNADCYVNKIHELRLILSTLTHKPSIIAITEVNYKLNKSFTYAELQLNGYTLYHNNLHSNSRGVVVYVDSELQSKQVYMDICYNENVIVSIKCHNGTSVIIENI